MSLLAFGPEHSSDSTLSLNWPTPLWCKAWSDVFLPQSTFHSVKPKTWPPVATHVPSRRWTGTWLTIPPHPTHYSSHRSLADFPCLPTMDSTAILRQVDVAPHHLRVSTIWIFSLFSGLIGLMDLRKHNGSYPGWVLISLGASFSWSRTVPLVLSAER